MVSAARRLVAHPPPRRLRLSPAPLQRRTSSTNTTITRRAAVVAVAASTSHHPLVLGATANSSTTNRWFCAAVGGDGVDVGSSGTKSKSRDTKGGTKPSTGSSSKSTAADRDGEEDAEEPVGSPSEETTKKKEPGEDEQQQKAAKEPTKEEQLQAEIKQLKDHLLRTLADQENTRRIAKNDVGAAQKFAIKSFAKSLLDVSDNLERALQAIPEGIDKQREDQPVLVNLLDGVRLTEDGLLKAFQANGLERFGKTGDAFDPNRHDALFEYADPDLPSGTLGQVLKSGFLLHQRVLRPAEVGVVKNPLDEDDKDNNNEKEKEAEAEPEKK